MTQTVSAQDARNKFAEVLNTAIYGLTSVIITRFNKPQAVIINYKEYERLMNPHLRFGKEEWEKGFKVFDRVRERNKKVSSRKIEKGVATAVTEVRRRSV